MKRISFITILLLAFIVFKKANAQADSIKKVDWDILLQENKNCSPIIFIRKPNKKSYTSFFVKLNNIEVEKLSSLEQKSLDLSQVDQDFKTDTEIGIAQKKSYLNIRILPIRYNSTTKTYEKLISYSIAITGESNLLKTKELKSYADNSALSQGDWYKIKVDTSGVYKLTYEQLKNIGLSSPKNVRVYGYGGKQLSFNNNDFTYDDMHESPIFMSKGDDDVFNEGDYILFFSHGALIWQYNETTSLYEHAIHNYSDYVYLFLTDSFNPGKRLESSIINGSSNYATSTTDKFQCYHETNINLIQSGLFWFTEQISSNDSKIYNFNFSNHISTEPVILTTYTAGQKIANTPNLYLKISNNSTNIATAITTKSAGSNYVYAQEALTKVSFTPNQNKISLNYKVTGGNSSSKVYLGYIRLNTRENLVFSGGQYSFRDKKTVGTNNLCKYTINNKGKNLVIWDITTPAYPKLINSKNNGLTTTFIDSSNILKEYIAFDGSSFLIPTFKGNDLGKIENQDLHGKKNINMVIVTAEEFIDEAHELAALRQNGEDPLNVLVTTPEKIYNEFSSGTPDASAIRNFMRFLYHSNENDLKYLLLFGDGSYDNKNTSASVSNFIPTFQNNEAVNDASSVATDDFYGLLDVNEGGYKGYMDIGVGRFPVSNESEAKLMIAKIKHYESPTSMGNWRTNICFIADDEDGGAHLNQAEELANDYVMKNHPEYNIEKVYFDAYKQKSTPAGERYPDVSEAIHDAVKKGALIIDYIGHGNPRLLGHEEVLTAPNVQKWQNFDKLAVFVTASCEVGRFDDHVSTSLGEWIVLNPKGGGVAALTTTRVVYSGSNQSLNRNFFSNIFNDSLRLGDIIRLSKNSTGTTTDTNTRKFTLLGDPSMKLAIPDNQALVTQINDNSISINIDNINISTDTIKALEKAHIHGYIVDANGDPVEKDGILFPTVYDKPQTASTLGNDKGSPIINFEIQNSILYKGQCSISQGSFDFEFMLPKDINYDYGNGKISLYAVLEDSIEAVGYTKDFTIGGINTTTEMDIDGPIIELYINDTTFKNGGIVNENPILFAKISDKSGINTSGAGIGHNATAIIDDNSDNIINLNSFYRGELNMNNVGKIIYELSDLEEGFHTLKLKVWDVYNNSSDAEISFNVIGASNMSIANISNGPNPFSDYTMFRFEHNQAGKDIDIKIRIFDSMGKLVKSIYRKDNTGSFNAEPIIWNGTSDFGNQLDNGLYIYNIELSTVDGGKTSKSSKLMIFR